MLKKQNLRWVNYFLIAILCICVQKSLLADQEEIRVPVEVSVDPYFELLLESESVRLDPDGNDAETTPIPPGSISFGSEISNNPDKTRQPVPETDGGFTTGRFGSAERTSFSTTHKTRTQVSVLNNVKPFELSISVLSEGASHSLLEMKSTDQKSAVRIKVDSNEKTKHPEYLVRSGSWVDFGLDGKLLIYRSHKTTSDIFTVSFAIIDLDPKTKADQYGGRILWTLSAVL
jgi:hypothetical protein